MTPRSVLLVGAVAVVAVGYVTALTGLGLLVIHLVMKYW
jgi:hypothetical protein